MGKAIVNDKEFILKQGDKNPFGFEVNGVPVELDTYIKENGMLCFLYKNHSYRAELISYNENDKIAIVKLNNKRFEIKLKDDSDLLLEQLGIGSKVQKVQNIKAPMPGLVLSVNVSEGDKVRKGDGLLVLEAMKMENLIKAHSDGRVKKIFAVKGAKVVKNQPLIEMD